MEKAAAFEFNFLLFFIEMCSGPLGPCFKKKFEPIKVVLSKVSSNICIPVTDCSDLNTFLNINFVS